ncbi:unnamed protein product [Bursaphelenchus okinawaensis]|uniref:CSN8/PSMD8/EIF3K domain-containing protein n=1 Tax=Bursaphelenchus okinawaensis TaxID=465554 RepID=A0A811KR88_9BILA|nr:unnamed protein product [Bursaphelenchus okinawaensis]CAG9111310.1 unnamed protein product [Bursaphelenchus okinawaensis]
MSDPPPPDPVVAEAPAEPAVEQQQEAEQAAPPAEPQVQVEPPQVPAPNAKDAPQPSPQNSIKLVEILAPESTKSPAELFVELLEKELGIALISLGEYVTIILMYIIQNDPNQARYAVLRSEHAYKDCPELRKLYELAEAAYNKDLSQCLLWIRSNPVHESFFPYMSEVRRRITAQMLTNIKNGFRSITYMNVCSLMHVREDDEDMLKCVQQSQWELSDIGIVTPADTAGFRQLVASLHDPVFGMEKSKTQARKQNGAVLDNLVRYSGFLDRN